MIDVPRSGKLVGDLPKEEAEHFTRCPLLRRLTLQLILAVAQLLRQSVVFLADM